MPITTVVNVCILIVSVQDSIIEFKTLVTNYVGFSR
jgi:hypothetical protein